MSDREKPFYGKWIYRDQEAIHIQNLMKKYQDLPVTEELKKKVYEELSREKFLGHITIPFRLVLRRDVYGKYPERLEVILDTKV